MGALGWINDNLNLFNPDSTVTDWAYLGYGNEIWDGVGDYFMADTRAAREGQKAARRAEGLVGEGYDQALGGAQDLADMGGRDFRAYRDDVRGGKYTTDPSQFQTGPYQQGVYGLNAPGFQQYQMGQDPGFQSYQMGQAPEFQSADAGQFDFDYQSSPGFQYARDEALKAVEGRASAQGRRLAGGTDKELMDVASGMAAQDYGNQYARARGAFEADRGFGAGQAQQENIFNQGGFQFGAGLGAQQSLAGNQYGQNAFQFGAGMGAQQSNLANQAAMQNYWNQQGMRQGEKQFGANFNQAANLQNYNMYNQQAQQQAGMMGGLAQTGYGGMQNLGQMQIGRGEAMANAALGVGNANANRQLAPASTVNQFLNQGTQLGSAYLSNRNTGGA